MITLKDLEPASRLIMIDASASSPPKTGDEEDDDEDGKGSRMDDNEA